MRVLLLVIALCFFPFLLIGNDFANDLNNFDQSSEILSDSLLEPPPSLPEPPPQQIPRPNHLPAPGEPLVNLSLIRQKLEVCYSKRDAAISCCSEKGRQSCLEESSEGSALLSQITQSAAALKSAKGMSGQCEAVKILQQKNAALTVLAQNNCKNRKEDCVLECENAHSRLSHEYQRECLTLPDHPLCVETRELLSSTKEDAGSCSSIDSTSSFASSLVTDYTKIRMADECVDGLKDENIAKLTTPGTFTPSSDAPTDCSNPANSSHPNCASKNPNPIPDISQTQPPFGQGSHESDSPPGFDPLTGASSDDFANDQAQYLNKLDQFNKNSKKLDSQLAKGSSQTGNSGLIPGGEGSTFTPLPGAPGVNPHKSSLFKEATAKKGWSSPSGKWKGSSSSSTSKGSLQSSFDFNSLLNNAKKPTKLKSQWVGINLKSLMRKPSSITLSNQTIRQDQWIFGVNSQLLHSLFSSGIPDRLSPQPPKRTKPKGIFPGLTFLKQNQSTHHFCALKTPNENLLDLVSTNQSYRKRIERFTQWQIYNTNKNLHCKNRKQSSQSNLNLVPKQQPYTKFTRGEYFDHSFLKLRLHKGFRADEKSPLWLFTNQTNEIFFTLLAKERAPSTDSLNTYQLYLKNKIPYQLKDGTTKYSQPLQVKQQIINGHKWIDAIHLNSERSGFYTRYLTTVYKDKAFLVSFNFHRNYFLKYADPINQMVKSLKINNSPQPNFRDEKAHTQFLALLKSNSLKAKELSGSYQSSSLTQEPFSKRSLSFILGVLLLLISAASFFFLKRKSS